MGKSHNEIGTTLYPPDVEFLLDTETTNEEAAEYARCLARIVVGDYDYKSNNRFIRGVISNVVGRAQAHREKVESISKKRQESGQQGAAARWQKMANEDFAISQENPQMANAIPQMANAIPQMANAIPQMANAIPQMANAKGNIANAIQYGGAPKDTRAYQTIPYQTIPNQINSPSIPQTERKEISFIDFWNSYLEWKDHKDGRSLSWHAIDPNATAMCKELLKMEVNIAAEVKQKCFDKNDNHKSVIPEWQTWKSFWEIAQSITDQSQTTISIYSRVIEERKDEKDILRTILKLANKIKAGYKPTDLYNFLRKSN